MFAPDHEAAASELARVCRPGARMALACWRPDGAIGDMFRTLAPFQPPAMPGVGSPFHWGKESHVSDLLGESFELEFEELASVLVGESGEAIWDLFSTSFGPVKTLAASLDADRRDEFRRAFVDLHERHRANGGIRMARTYLLTMGRRR
jgi:hypothetical protein